MWFRKNLSCNLIDFKKGIKILREDFMIVKIMVGEIWLNWLGNLCVWKDLFNILGLNLVMKGFIWNYVVFVVGWGYIIFKLVRYKCYF